MALASSCDLGAAIQAIVLVDEMVCCVGEKLPENSGLKVFDPLAEQSADGSSPQPAEDASSPASPPQNTASAASAAAARGPAEADIELDETDFDVSNVTHMCKVIDENVRLLAMSPWIRVIGGLREEEEKKTSQVRQLMHFCLHIAPETSARAVYNMHYRLSLDSSSFDGFQGTV